ncbi:unnamed protein product [Effrenium voratum]|uniref:Uncharacterized protein n=1 Tax=Effrenium voratum TaxID=2562239 RepID=A0AA36MMH8_9DINO|nr:unnamed protein product [Effrenium voratum]
MNILEKVGDFISKRGEDLQKQISGVRVFSAYITNATDDVLQLIGQPILSHARHCRHFASLQPGEAGVVSFSHDGEHGGALQFRLGDDTLFLGQYMRASYSSLFGSDQFVVEFSGKTLNQFYAGMPQDFMGVPGRGTSRAMGLLHSALVRQARASANSEVEVILVPAKDVHIVEELDSLDSLQHRGRRPKRPKKSAMKMSLGGYRELQAIKERDPEFYKFLVEQDQQLLDFRDDEGEPSEAEGEGAEGHLVQSTKTTRFLTLARFRQIEGSAKASFSAFKAAANAYHLAVKSINQKEGEEGDEDQPERKKPRSANSVKKQKRYGLTIDSEETFSEILEWCLANFVELLEHHAEPEAKQRSPTPDPTHYSGWKRVKKMSQMFWDETLFLLTNAKSVEMQEAVLRTCSSARALCWLWAFPQLQKRYLKCCCSLWSSAPSKAQQSSTRLLGFLFLRNAAAMATLRKGLSLEAILRSVLRSFLNSANANFSWRACSSFRFMENCILELFGMDDQVAYRVGYVFIRQLALVLRNVLLQGAEKSKESKAKQPKAKAKAKGKKEKDRGKEKPKPKVKSKKDLEMLMGWQFVRAMFLWTRLVGLKPLKELAYPLCMVILGAVKSRLSLDNAPFALHGVRALNRIAEHLQQLVPVSSLLLRMLEMTEKSLENAERGEGPPDLDVVLRLHNTKQETLERVGCGICEAFVEHLGLCSRCVAFPELAAPVVLHLRRHSKHCRSEPLRKQLKALVAAIEESSQTVQRFREQLTEPPANGQLCALGAEATALAKQRQQLLQKRQDKEKTNVEAELSGAPPPKKRKREKQ